MSFNVSPIPSLIPGVKDPFSISNTPRLFMGRQESKVSLNKGKSGKEHGDISNFPSSISGIAWNDSLFLVDAEGRTRRSKYVLSMSNSLCSIGDNKKGSKRSNSKEQAKNNTTNSD